MSPLHESILSIPLAGQDSSPLFTCLPPEIRNYIFSFAVTDYLDTSPPEQYSLSTPYTRPSYFAPRRSDVQLLRTCRAIYAECWFMPFLRKEQTHWLGHPDRAPPEYDVRRKPNELASTLQRIQQALPEGQRAEIDGMHVFAQMFRVEDGTLADLVATKHLHPKRLTVTIRHTDWWYWENDEPLHIQGEWLQRFGRSLSSSTREVVLELETTMRKKKQLEEIGRKVTEKWFIERGTEVGGEMMYADKASIGTSTWTGESSWNRQQWVRDESESGKIEYHIITIPFRWESAITRKGEGVSDEAVGFANRDFGEIKSELYCDVPGAERDWGRGWQDIHLPHYHDSAEGSDDQWDEDSEHDTSDDEAI